MLAETPDNAQCRRSMGICLLKQKQYVRATEHATKAIGLAPDRAFNHYVMALVWAERNYLDSAVRVDPPGNRDKP